MRILPLRLRPIWLLFLVILGCDGGPTDPGSGRLRVSILGLPPGSTADVTVTGPGGFSQPVTASQTLNQLAPGTYAVSATTVVIGAAQYGPAPVSQAVVVNGGGAQTTASILYSSSKGNLAVTINGLGTDNTAAVTVTGPGGYTQEVHSSTTLTSLNPGDYTVAARDTLATGGTPHTAAPASQTVTVTPNTTATASVTYSPPTGGSLNLRVAGLYVTQSTQTFAGAVPLVRNRNGYVRVFVVANRTTNTTTEVPQVRVRFFNGLTKVDSNLVVLAPGNPVPTVVNESSLIYSWNVPVSGTLIQAGFGIQAEVDPANTVAETDEGDNVFSALAPSGPTIVTAPTLSITFVPILQPGAAQQGDVTAANKNTYLDLTQRMHPIDAVDAAVHSAVTTDTTLEADGQGWIEVLDKLDMIRVAEGSSRYYYGVAKVGYGGGVAGIGYVGDGSLNGRTALGWDDSGTRDEVAAHELGHNWGRNHAPCGTPLPAGLDPSYPRSNGSIGSYGLDVSTASLKASTLPDIMGYCDPKWISDYTYLGVMNFRAAHPLVVGGAAAAAVQPSLVVWGHMNDGAIVLEPAFQVNTRPSLPTHSGPYSIEGRASDGSTVFSLSFSPQQIADLPGNPQTFAFAVPMSSANSGRLTSLHLRGQGREAVRTSAAPPGGALPDGVDVRGRGRGRVGLRWNAGAHPLVVVRDPDTGEVLSLARGGAAELSTSKGQVDLVLSDGVKSKVRRVRVAR
jgi:hypothetical protein